MEQRPFRKSLQTTACQVPSLPLFGAGVASILGQLDFDSAEDDLEPFDSRASLRVGLDDAGFEVVADLFQPGPLSRVRLQDRTPDTCFSDLRLPLEIIRFEW